MKKVIIASTNPVKVDVARNAFASVFPDQQFEFVSIQSDSGVPDQPMDGETRLGAQNRLAFIYAQHPDADFWISQEGGLFREGEKLFNRAWIAVRDAQGHVTEASTASFYLPKEITRLVLSGMELGHANDVFFGSVNSKQGTGAIGHLTDGRINRTEYYTQAAIIALSELKHQDWY